MASFKIVGNLNPVVGVPEVYSVVELPQQSFLINTPNMDFTFFSSKTKWKMWMHKDGYWRTVKGVKKEGATVIFTFLQKSLRCRALRMTATVNGEEVVVDIKPQKTNQSEIVNIEILNINHDKPTKHFSYGELFTARIHAVDLDLTSVVVTLWEDDANGAGHNKENTFIESKTASIINGRADVDFYLSPNFSALANSKFSSGSDSEGPMHEYYVTAESIHSEPKLVASPNFDIANDIVIPDFEPTNSLMTVEVLSKEEEKTGTCECESYNLYYGKKVSCAFRKKVMKISKELWPSNHKEMANGLMAVMHRETRGSLAANQLEGYKSLIPREEMTKDIFDKLNSTNNSRTSRAVGLIQFTQNALVQMDEFENGQGFDKLHTIKLAYANMTEVEQLSKVKKYMQAVKTLPKVPEDIYIAVFAPYNVGDSKDTIMYRKGTNAYTSNPGLDKDDNGIEIKELLGEFKTSLAEGVEYSTYKCNNNEKEESEDDKNNKWHHPVNNPQLRGWYAIWAPERSIHSSNIVGRSKGKHDGIDLYAPTGTTLYACVDGEVNEIYYSESYGNCVNIKGDYDGKTLWFFYAHLSETFIKAKDESGNPTKVTVGMEIGKSGKTGSSATALNSNQVHLHFEVRTTSARTGGRVSPFDNIKELDDEVVKNPKKESQP